MTKMAWNEANVSGNTLQKLYQQQKEEREKSETRNKICWCICFTMVLSAAVIAFLLLGYMYKETFNNKETSTSEGCESRLAEYNYTFTMILRDLCEATCSKRSQDTFEADVYNIVTADTTSMRTRCVACCQQLNQENCESQNIEDEVPVNDCRWVVVGSGGGGCVSIGTLHGVIG